MNYKTYYEYLSFNDAKLFTVVCLPDASGQYPTVIYRSPYVEAEETLSEEELCEKKAVDYLGWVERGYAVVVQHCRGCGKSEGEFIPDIYEREDGLLLRKWIREQSFYNGEIYLCGASYTACLHFLTAPF